MNNEMQTWRPWTPEERAKHQEALEHIQKLNEEIIKKGELDTINVLRKQIRNDVEEYNLFRQTPYIAGDKFNFYRNYLLERIDINIAQLKELVGENNE
jgi:hypothetical protein